MKKQLLFGFHFIALLVMAQMVLGQVTMPAAISISPSNGTAWDEITLKLDPTKACVPSGKGSVIGAAVVKMHSAAVLFDQKEGFESKSIWGALGVDYDKVPKDGIHTAPDLLPNGDGTYSITFVPADFYGVEEGSTVIGITAVFNGGSWDNECKDFKNDACGDFFIPLTYVNPTPALKFKLDLTYQEELGNFDKDGGKAYVTVDGTEYEMDQLLEGIFPVAKYEKLLTEGIVKDQVYSYKFKMNETEETIDARTVTATASQQTLSHYFNDEAPVLGVTVTFKVDMKYYMRDSKFDASSQYVDIAGEVNGWDGTNYHLTGPDNDSIYSIDIDGLDVGDTYAYKYRIDGSWSDATSEFPAGGPNRRYTVRSGGGQTYDVYNNYRPGWVPVTLAVNMTRAVSIAQFDPLADFVDVAGTLNGWGGSNQLFDDNPGDDANIYIAIPPVLAKIGDTIQFKFRIDGSWADDKSEFPGGGPNRTLIIADTTGGVVNKPDTVWFNDIPLSVESFRKEKIQEVTIYPNPVQELLYIDNAFEIRQLRLVNMLGQVVRDLRVDSRMFMTIDVSDLNPGIYVLSVYGDNGYKGIAKFMIK